MKASLKNQSPGIARSVADGNADHGKRNAATGLGPRHGEKVRQEGAQPSTGILPPPAGLSQAGGPRRPGAPPSDRALRLIMAGLVVSNVSKALWPATPLVKDPFEAWRFDEPGECLAIHLRASGLVSIDVLPYARDGFEDFIDVYGLPEGVPIIERPSGGREYVFAVPAGYRLSAYGCLLNGVQARGVDSDSGVTPAPQRDGDLRYLADAYARGAVPVLPEWLFRRFCRCPAGSIVWTLGEGRQ